MADPFCRVRNGAWSPCQLHDLGSWAVQPCCCGAWNVTSKAGVLYEAPREGGALAPKLPLPGVAACRCETCWMWVSDPSPLWLASAEPLSQMMPAKAVCLGTPSNALGSLCPPDHGLAFLLLCGHAFEGACCLCPAAYHPPAVGARLAAFWVGPVHADVVKAAPPAGASRTAQLAAVHQQLEQAGLFKTSPWAYWGVAARCCCLLAAAVLCLMQQWPVPGAVLLGLYWQQVSLSMTNCNSACLRVQADSAAVTTDSL